MEEQNFNEEDTRKFYRLLAHENETEVRLLDPSKKESPISVFVKTEDEFIDTCKNYNGKRNVYAGINERTAGGTKANQVVFVKRIALDIDAPRADGQQPATDEELKTAEKIKDSIINKIKESGYKEPAVIFSGNGYQAIIKIPKITITDQNRSETENKLQLFQKRIQDVFSVDNAIDNIGDLPRILKVPGTYNIKGTHSQERPHRLSKFITDPEIIEEDKQLLEDIFKLEETYEEYDIEEIEELNQNALPKCINYLYNEHKFSNSNGWMRTVSVLAEFFRGIGLSEQKTISLLLDWNKKQLYHEENEEKEIKRIVKEIYSKGIFCPNCKKIRTESSGFPYAGLKEIFKGVKLGKCCNNYKNPVVYYNAKTKPKRKESFNIDSFIFDDNELIKTKPFPMHILNEDGTDVFCYGVKLPREEDIYTKDGTIIGKKQRYRPAIISKNRIRLYSEDFIKETKTDYESFPTENILKWSLKSIKEIKDQTSLKIDKKEVFKEIRDAYQEFIYFREDEWYDVHTLWDIGSYFFILFSNYPLLELRGLMGSAKTKVMSLSSFISFNSTGTMVNPSESTLFRLTHELRCTKYIDEVENLFAYNKNTGQYEPDPRAQLINESYHKKGKVPRQEKFGNVYKTVFYYVYSPTMIAGIAGLKGATESRAITNVMTKNPKNDPRGNKEVEDHEEDKRWQQLRDKLYLLGLQSWKELLEQKDKIDYSTIKGRNKQLWQPLLMIARWIDEEIYLKVKKFAEKLSIQKTIDVIGEGTLDYLLFEVIRSFVATGKDRVDGNRIYLQAIKEMLGRKEPKFVNIANKTLSSHIDRLGFKNCRAKDTNKGSYFDISVKTFNDIAEPLAEEFIIKEEPQHGN